VAEHIELAWPVAPDAAQRRVVILDETTGEHIKLELDEPRASVDASSLKPGHVYHWRPQVRTEDDEDWQNVLPYLRLFPPDRGAGRTTTLRWPDMGAAAYRVVIRDETVGDIVVKDGVVSTEYEVDWSDLDPTHEHRYRVQVCDGDGWLDDSPYRPLRPPVTLVAESTRAQAVARQGAGELIFLFTVDTEVSMRQMRLPDPQTALDHQVFAVHDGREVGIRYLMDLLDQFGFKGTFFVDILLEYQLGEGSLVPVIEAIQERGHDIQLHLHAAPHLRFAREERLRRLWPAVASDDVDLFRAALEAAMDLFVRRVGRTPVAYRSGAYHLADEFFPVLSEFGLHIDTSLYPFKNCRVSPWMHVRTQPFWVGDVLEVPVSWMAYERNGVLTPQQLAPVTSGGVQHPALANLEAPADAPPITLVYLAHSNSLLRKERCFDDPLREAWNRRAREIWTPEEYELAQLPSGTELVFLEEPEETRIDVLTGSLQRLASRGDVKGITFQELHDGGLERWEPPAWPVDPVAVSPRPGQATIAGMRRYSEAFLDHLDREASRDGA
jgi:hypothetical protein